MEYAKIGIYRGRRVPRECRLLRGQVVWTDIRTGEGAEEPEEKRGNAREFRVRADGEKGESGLRRNISNFIAKSHFARSRTNASALLHVLRPDLGLSSTSTSTFAAPRRRISIRPRFLPGARRSSLRRGWLCRCEDLREIDAQIPMPTGQGRDKAIKWNSRGSGASERASAKGNAGLPRLARIERFATLMYEIHVRHG